MRAALRPGLLAALLAALAGLAQAQPCTLVFGQGRNPPLKGGPDWDGLNQRFNTAVATTLEAGGQRTVPMNASAAQIDPEAAGIALLREADRLRCATLVETAVFADEQGTLVLRLRAYPLLPQLGAGGAIVGLGIGAPLFITQRDLDMKSLLRIKPELIGQQLATDYLQREPR